MKYILLIVSCILFHDFHTQESSDYPESFEIGQFLKYECTQDSIYQSISLIPLDSLNMNYILVYEDLKNKRSNSMDIGLVFPTGEGIFVQLTDIRTDEIFYDQIEWNYFNNLHGLTLSISLDFEDSFVVIDKIGYMKCSMKRESINSIKPK